MNLQVGVLQGLERKCKDLLKVSEAAGVLARFLDSFRTKALVLQFKILVSVGSFEVVWLLTGRFYHTWVWDLGLQAKIKCTAKALGLHSESLNPKP